jgi:hypothetical protein
VVNPKTGQGREFHRFGTYAFPLCEVAATFVAVGTSPSGYRPADRARAAGRGRGRPALGVGR